MHNLPKEYANYTIEKFLLLLVKYSNKFGGDLFLLLSLDKNEKGK